MIIDKKYKLFPHIAANGHFQVLHWAVNNGCAFGTKTCSYAAMGGHLGIIKLLRSWGCQWDETTCENALLSGNLYTNNFNL